MIYLDHNATTHTHPIAIEQMAKYILSPLNPSALHSTGRQGKALLDAARRHISELLHFDTKFRDYNITLTASGTEANNLILSNFAHEQVFVSAIEHASILAWSRVSPNVHVIKVDSNGVVDIDDMEIKLAQASQSQPHKKKLISVMLANNETGVIQPVAQIVQLAKKYSASVHSDMVQAVGKIEVNLVDLGIDFATISGHKFGGPVGAAALVSKTSIALKPQMLGGGQERGLRSGTENVSAIVGFGQAAIQVKDEIAPYAVKMRSMRNRIETELKKCLPQIEIVGEKTERIPNTSLIINAKKSAEILLIALDMHAIAVSAGAACSSGKVRKSSVLSAMGYSDQQAKSAIRVSLGYNTTLDEVQEFIKIYLQLNG